LCQEERKGIERDNPLVLTSVLMDQVKAVEADNSRSASSIMSGCVSRLTPCPPLLGSFGVLVEQYCLGTGLTEAHSLLQQV
jgi:hypothetical protein